MVAWYWLIIIFFGGIVFTTFTDKWFDFENLLTNITYVVVFIPLSFYAMFLQLTVVHPPTQAQFDMVKQVYKDNRKIKHLCRNLYLWKDPQASQIWSKIFLVRVRKEG